MKRYKLLIATIVLIIILAGILAIPDVFYKNAGESFSIGSPGNGRVINPYKIKYNSKNVRYFSPVSYFVMNNCYVHSLLAKTLTDSYKSCEKTCPGTKFRIMECADKKGGKLLLHRTHRNGLSVDFMVPKIRNNKQVRIFDHLGLWHYLLNFDSDGRLLLNKKLRIDFNTIAEHIIALDNAARENGLKISKVIFKSDLKDDLFLTRQGAEIKHRGIYFTKYLPEMVDRMHDDHYHIDFEVIND